MYIARRALTFMQSLLKSYGPTKIKEVLWDKEFSGDKWNFIDNTLGDCVYPHLEKWAANGRILDLGCGPGNTANEVAANSYQTYVGMDISEAALVKARKRTVESGRANKNSFAQGDFLSYVPPQRFDVILFRESMYHVPLGKVKAILDRFSNYLSDRGVFIVRMAVADDNGNSKYRPTAMVEIMETEFDVLEKAQYGEDAATVIVFRPKRQRPKDSRAFSTKS